MRKGPAPLDLTGHKYARLTVLESAPRRYGMISWLCQCECGQTTVATSNALRTGHTRSCGCLHREVVTANGPNVLRRMYKEGLANLNTLRAAYRKKAEQRGYVCELTDSEMEQFFKGNCTYCGIEPSAVYKGHPTNNGHYIYNGIDRVDNSKGYTIENAVSCCKTCNLSKRTQTLEEFKSWVMRTASHLCKVQ